MEKYQNLAVNKRQTPQTEKAKTNQVENNAGGYVFATSDWTRLDRFLILGSASNTYYQYAQELTKENASVIQGLIEKDGLKVVDRLVEISTAGRAPKNDPAIFVLAMCSASDNLAVRKKAFEALPKVCRIPTHLFTFIEYSKLFRGKGRLYKTALQDWYLKKDGDQLAYQMVKYRQRNGWTHRDVLRLAKPKGATGIHQDMFAWATGKSYLAKSKILEGFIECQEAKGPNDCADIVRRFGLTREMVPTEYLKSAPVWEALLEKMPMTAMIRNLGNMGSCGLLTPMSEATGKVISKINQESIEKSMIHPMAILYAAKTYAQGHGVRGSNSWPVDGNIADVLDDAFYMAFKNVKATGKRFLVGLDVSGSMSGMWGSSVGILSAREVAAAMSVVHVRTEPLVHYMAFSSGFIPLNITKKSTINSVINDTSNLPFDRTDCALPMLYALKNRIPVDAFIIYTDNETWFGDIHPFQALKKYRETMGINAKLIVCGVTSTGFSIADPDDDGMLDVVGFDSAIPTVINNFISE